MKKRLGGGAFISRPTTTSSRQMTELDTNVTRETEARRAFLNTTNPYKWVNEDRAGRVVNSNHDGKGETLWLTEKREREISGTACSEGQSRR